MDGKELISPSDLPPFYPQQPPHHHRMLGGGGGGHNSPSSLAGMHSVIRPMPNMSMSPTAILQSIGGGGPGSLSGMQFHMDGTPSPSSMMHGGNMSGSGNMVSVSGSGGTMPVASQPEPVKRKRGRPRKYGPDGAMKQHLASTQGQQQQQHHQMMGAAPPPRMGSMSGQDMAGGLDDAAAKKRRGRPPGTGKKLSSPKPSGNAFSGSAGTSFTPHIITASPSEDVAGKIAAFVSQSPRAVCVLSAMGSISRAVLRNLGDHASSAAMAPPSYNNNPSIYEGLYEILSLSGSYNLNEAQLNQSDGLSVTLCSPERHVIGGVLGGALVAASTVQVVLGTFVNGGSKSKSKKAVKPPPAFGPDTLTGGGGPDASPSSGGHNQNLTPPPSIVTTGGWPSSGIFDTRSSSIDINNSSRG
ncbi:AT-hook motif nuclear-localized protein 10 [Lolium perenne]|uniref:AT-hook motif nuclear-localized protein 10 n=1 Tax=Lolium perenne TaxID=4522 RepID=UPI0021F672AE|nr:AT-hook motif nuclear-localized protein 9-like [Lolium perenne]